MPLVKNATSEDLYKLLAELRADAIVLRKTKPSFDTLAAMYLDLLNAKLSESRYARRVEQVFD